MAIIQWRDSACAPTVQSQATGPNMYFDFLPVHFNLTLTDVDRDSHYLTYIISSVELLLFGKQLKITALAGFDNVAICYRVLQCLATNGKTVWNQVSTNPNAVITQHPCRLHNDIGPLDTLRRLTRAMICNWINILQNDEQ